MAWAIRKYNLPLDLEEGESVGNLVLARCLKLYKPERGKFSTYFCLSLLRSLATEANKRRRAGLPSGVDADDCETHDVHEWEQADACQAVLKILSTTERKIVSLLERGASVRKIAAIMGLSRHRAAYLVERIRRKVRRLYAT